jgi:hypothetical protein
METWNKQTHFYSTVHPIHRRTFRQMEHMYPCVW